MDREDARRLSPDAQHERRRQVVRAYKRGVNRRQIAREFGLSYSSARMIVNRFKQDGLQGIESGRQLPHPQCGLRFKSGSTRPIQRSNNAPKKRCQDPLGDETAVVNTDMRGRGYAPKGDTPVAHVVGGTREKLSMISTVTNHGKTSWMIIDGNFNHVRLIEFFQAFVKQPDARFSWCSIILSACITVRR